MIGALGVEIVMSRTYSLYDTATGLFTGKQVQSSDSGLQIAPPAGIAALEGSYDPLSQRVDRASGQIVDYQPPAPSEEHEWDAGKKRWRVSSAVRESAGRRTQVLGQIQTLEANQHRALREATLGDPVALKRLMEIDAAIDELRKELR